MGRTLTYFISDVHLGLQAFDPVDRERRLVKFLRGIEPASTEAVYLMGDIWDFWYEWRYTVPKGYFKVFSALSDLIESGVKVYFFRGNHDVWAYSYFSEIGITLLTQPHFTRIGSRTFCLGHGDGLGPTKLSYRIMRGVFHCKVTQWLFSTFIHPTVAMWFGLGWSHSNRLKHKSHYEWKGDAEPLMVYSRSVLAQRAVDYFVFGHFHVGVCESLGESSKLYVTDCWLEKDSALIYDSDRDSFKEM